MPAIKDILTIIVQIIELEKKIEEAIQGEKDKRRKKKIKKAAAKRDVAALRKLILDR